MQRIISQFRKFKADHDGASAVEFAIIVPIFLVILFGLITYGSYLSVVHGVQQLTAEAARASIGGLTDAERMSLAAKNINFNINSYPMLSADQLTVTLAATDPSTGVFRVSVRYDASDMFIFQLPALVRGPDPILVRSAAIQRGGY